MIALPNRIQPSDPQLRAVQDNIIEIVERLCKQQILDGVVLENVVIGTALTPVSHKLMRIPIGYLIISKNGPGDIYDVGRDSNFLNLQSSVAVTAKIWVF